MIIPTFILLVFAAPNSHQVRLEGITNCLHVCQQPVCAVFRFVQDWDTICIEQLLAAGSMSSHGKAVLSCYPVGYEGAGAAAVWPEPAPITVLCASSFADDGLLRTVGR